MLLALALQELHHHDIVIERLGGADHLVVVRRESGHSLEGLVELAGGAKVVEGENDGGGGAQAVQVFRFQGGGAFQFQVDELAAVGGGLYQNVNLGRHRSPELASVDGAAAGGDHQGFGVVIGEAAQLLERQRRLSNVV